MYFVTLIFYHFMYYVRNISIIPLSGPIIFCPYPISVPLYWSPLPSQGGPASVVTLGMKDLYVLDMCSNTRLNSSSLNLLSLFLRFILWGFGLFYFCLHVCIAPHASQIGVTNNYETPYGYWKPNPSSLQRTVSALNH